MLPDAALEPDSEPEAVVEEDEGCEEESPAELPACALEAASADEDEDVAGALAAELALGEARLELEDEAGWEVLAEEEPEAGAWSCLVV